MSLHSFTEYVKFRLRAKGRHGTHSPFVYALVEDVIQGEGRGRTTLDPLPGSRYNSLLCRMATYYSYNSCSQLSAGESQAPLLGEYDMLLFPEYSLVEWPTFLTANRNVLSEGGVMVIPEIHRSKEATRSWNAVCADKAVKMSIDMYGIGLLFFRKEFQEKQHFVLKS